MGIGVDPSAIPDTRRARRRRRFQKLRTLTVLVGILLLVLSVFVALSSVFQDMETTQAKLLRMSMIYASTGIALIALYFLCFVLPDALERRKSAAWKRRYKKVGLDDEGTPVSPDAGSKDGIALVFVLVMVALVSVLAVQAQVAARLAQREQLAVERTATLRLAAAEAAWAAVQRLADDDDLLVDGTNETWHAVEDIVTPIGVATRTVVRDLQARVDLNNLSVKLDPGLRPPTEIVGDLLVRCGEFSGSAWVDAVEDWVDEDGEGIRESSFYQEKDAPYGVPNKPMASLAELRWTEGFKSTLFEKHPRFDLRDEFRADFTDAADVIPVPRKRIIPLNINTADRDALVSVFGAGREALADTILAMRAEKAIRSLDGLMMIMDPVAIEMLRPLLDVKTRYFSIDVRTHVEDQSSALRVLAQRDASGRVELLQWIL